MSWFCKTCIDGGEMDEAFLYADSNGIVFDCKEDECVIEICESCGGGYFDRYGNRMRMECDDELCDTDDDE